MPSARLPDARELVGRAVGVDPVDLSELAAGEDAAVGPGRDALGVIEAVGVDAHVGDGDERRSLGKDRAHGSS